MYIMLKTKTFGMETSS